jgi:lipoyl(octanoyl) transferase
LELKIGSIGLRLKNWISYFGMSINVCNDLSYFNGIIPCGNSGFGVTSLLEQGQKTSLTELDYVLKQKFDSIFSIDDTKRKM